MANMEKTEKATLSLAQTTRESYEKVVEHTVAMRERNLRFAQSMMEDSTRELRERAEANQAIVEEFMERAEKQRDAFKTAVEESLDAYINLAFAPLSHYREGLEAAGKAAR